MEFCEANYLAACSRSPRVSDSTLGDGTTTNLWHRQYEHYMAEIVPLMRRCRICGGECDYRDNAHNLCVERQKRGMEAPVERSIRPCPCRRCH